MRPEEWSKLRSPQNYFFGKSLPENFSCPSGILFFFRSHNHYQGERSHAHSRYTLVIAKSNLTYFIDHSKIDLTSGEALLIYPYHQRYLYSSKDKAERLYMTFLVDAKQKYLPPPGKYRMTKQCSRYLSDALDAYEGNRMIELAFSCTLLLREISDQKIRTDIPVFSPAVSSAIQYMEAHLSELFTLRMLSENCHISESYLRFIFHKEVGMPPSEYLAKLRLNAARQYLKFSSRSVQDIARLCGFTSAFAFSHFFKRNQGCSPIYYRKQ